MTEWITMIAVAMLAMVVGGIFMTALRRKDRMLYASNSFPVGRHDTGNLPRLAEAAITPRYLLGKKGTNPETQAVVSGASDIPDFVITDEAEIAGDPIGCAALGVASGTIPMVASEAIDIESVHFLVPAANGKVKALPTAAGTYYVIGKPMSSASGDGAALEVAHCSPNPVIVTE
ncbi:MAG: hypothetical protein PHP44_11090 [Kiritimatiellae bacterium]|nr:hypothetical protein [Kiritimatiellia bacterium]